MPTTEETRAQLQQIVSTADGMAKDLAAKESPTIDDLKQGLVAAIRLSTASTASIVNALGPSPPPAISPAELERRGKINAIWTESHLNGANERSKMVVDLALLAMRSVFLVNGAAVVALLTFIGTSRGGVDPAYLRQAFTDFGIGLLLALIAMGASYVAQHLFSNTEYDKAHAVYEAVYYGKPERAVSQDDRIGFVLQIGAFFVALFSVIFFGLGSFAALDAILPAAR